MRKSRAPRLDRGVRTQEETESVRRMEDAFRRRTEESERSFAEALERWKQNGAAAAHRLDRTGARP
jgi:hypothetical protein